MIFRRMRPVTAPYIIAIPSIEAFTEAELRAACRVALRLGSVLYLCAPHRP
jgi:hypothetical protein